MDANKWQRYEKISIELTRLVGGQENIQGVAHCATCLRIVLNDNDLADLKAIGEVDIAKGVFVVGDQVQIIFGASLVNDVYKVFAEHNKKKAVHNLGLIRRLVMFIIKLMKAYYGRSMRRIRKTIGRKPEKELSLILAVLRVLYTNDLLDSIDELAK